MTETQIKKQIADIRSVTREALKSKEAAAAFLKAAGIALTPKKAATPGADKKQRTLSQINRKPLTMNQDCKF